jgi:hypothetical protein
MSSNSTFHSVVADTGNIAELGQVGADRIDQHSTLANKQLLGPML